MQNYKMFYTSVFQRKLDDSEKSFQKWVEKILDQLVENPFVGKPLSVEWFREKKYGKFRIYYLIYENVKCV